MKSLFRLVFFGFMFGGWGLAALSLHVVRTPTAIGLIPKDRLGVVDTYVDTRNWKIADATDHPLLVSRLLATNQVELLRHISGDSEGDLERKLADAVKHGRGRATTAVSSAIDVSAVEKWWQRR